MEPGCDRETACAPGAERNSAGVPPNNLHGGLYEDDAVMGGLLGGKVANSALAGC